VRPDLNATRIIVLEPIVTSVYNAMVLAVNRRFSNGILLNANYTLSKSEDNGQNSATFFGGNQPYDAMNLGLVDGRSTSDFDRRHRFVGSFLYQPPYLRGVGVSGVVTLESGLPISQNISGSLAGGVGAVNSSSTNGTGGASFAPWVGRNTERYPRRKTVDVRLSKRFAAGGTRQVELLWEAFNLFNTKNPTLASSTAYNVSSSSYDPVANIATVNLTRNSGHLVPTSASNTFFGPRDMQVGLRLLW
jgi:hypothetical protein